MTAPLLALALSGAAGVSHPLQSEPAPEGHRATIVVDVEGTAVPYDPMVFGGFIEHLGKQISIG